MPQKHIFVSQATLNLGRNRAHRTLERKMDEEPDLRFINEGTLSISVPNGRYAEFCPHLHYCYKQDVDSNCFYLKFLGCLEARQLEKTHPLNQIDKFNLKYKRG